jgi:WXG100 family type VII secretion target
MSDQTWLFAAIHGAIGTLRTHAGTVNGQHQQLDQLATAGRALWTGDASEQWGIEQGNLNARYGTFFAALTDYIGAVEEATLQMEAQEKLNQSSFA